MGAIRPVISFSAEGCYLFIEVEMSWQAYVDTQMIQKNLKQAAIAGHNDDIKKLLNNYENSAEMAASGINLAGQKYFYLSGTDEVLRGKQGKGGVHIMKTNQTVLIGVYDEPLQGPEAANITEGLGSYLKNCGY